jgi:Undecaprenyl-phosphate glucose phosphotransferase
MFNRHRDLFATGLFLLDGTILAAAWLAAYALRFHVLGLPAPLGVPPLSLYLWIGAVLMLVALLVLRTLRLYRSARTARLGYELFALAQGVAIVTGLAGLASFFARGELSRATLAIFAVIAIVALWSSRLALRFVLRALRRGGHNLRHAIVVGTGDMAQELIKKIHDHPDFGILVRGVLAANDADARRERVAGARVLGTVAQLPGIVEHEGVELVYLALARSEWQAEEQALTRLADSTAAVRLVPDLVRAFALNASVEDFDGMPIVSLTDNPGEGWSAVTKRAFDLVFSGVGLVAIAPLLLAIAIWIRVGSPGPVLFTQDRVGLNGRRFRMLKFRTMREDAEADGPGWTRPVDPRRTRAGAVLRPLSLDELPQLWNVFLGQMSLVGPRPEQPFYVAQFRASVPRYMLRHHVKAGITGWAQVHGLRGDTPLDRRIEYDLYYIRHWSILLDLKILMLTVARVFRDANAH